MTKTELRREFLAKRRALSCAEINQRSQRIAEQFITYFNSQELTHKAPYIHTFLPIRRHNEVDTWLIIQKIWVDLSHVGISIPVLDSVTRNMNHYALLPNTPLIENNLGIPEPSTEHRHKTDLSRIVVVLVPLLTFDRRGHRVGYGGGYYDRFLVECRFECRKIGLSLFEPVEQIDGIEPTDVRLDACITPNQTYFF